MDPFLALLHGISVVPLVPFQSAGFFLAGVAAAGIGLLLLRRTSFWFSGTDAAKLQKRLRESVNLLNAVMYSMDEGLIVVGRDYKIVLVNRVAGIMLRTAPADLAGLDIRQAVGFVKGERNPIPFELPLEPVIEHGEIIILKALDEGIYAKDKNDKLFPVSLFLASLIVEGKRQGAVITFTDITEEKRLNEARVSFISIASHQLHTPLTGIRWFAEMLLDGDVGALTKGQRNFTDRIYEGTTRMIDLVNLLLQIARVEAGRVIVDPRPLDFKQLLDDVIMSMKPQIEKKKHVISLHVPSQDVPHVPLDKDIMWQAVQNLIDNAVRYSYPGTEIVISIAFDAKKQKFICSVQDHGIGIPRGQQNRMFQKFYRADNAIKYVPEGSGLGLNLVKQLVEDWGGAIWFESQEGEGSTFFFTVPLIGMKPRQGDVRLMT